MNNEIVSYFLRLHAEDFAGMVADLQSLGAEQLWHKTPEGTSVANLLCHVCEMEQFWIEWGLCNMPYDRDRQLEFDRKQDLDAQQLAERLQVRCDRTQELVSECSEENWSREREFHGDTFTGAGILVWHTRHLGLHRGHVQAHCRWLRQQSAQSLKLTE